MKKKTKTKIAVLLEKKGMSQAELIRRINEISDTDIGKDRISKICTGRLQNYTLFTARLISEALGVKIDDIVEF